MPSQKTTLRSCNRCRRANSVQVRLQKRLRETWRAHVAILDAKLGFVHRSSVASLAGTDYGTVCLVRSLSRRLQKCGTGHPTLVLMVLHDVSGGPNRYLQAIFTADEMRRHLVDHAVFSDVHMQREIEARLDAAPLDHVVVVHVAAKQPLGAGSNQRYKLSQPHDRWGDAPVVHFEQEWFRRMARMVVRDVA